MEGKPACVSFIIFIVLQQRCRTFEGLHYITISINHLKEKETTNSLNSKKVQIPTNELYHRYRRISGDWTKTQHSLGTCEADSHQRESSLLPTVRTHDSPMNIYLWGILAC